MLIDTLKMLCALPGVSGFEDEVRDCITGNINGYADEITVDVMGNLIVYKKGSKTTALKTVFCAHMDEVGLVITGITDDGYLKFATGGVDKRVVVGKTVTIGKNRVFGLKDYIGPAVVTPANFASIGENSFVNSYDEFELRWNYTGEVNIEVEARTVWEEEKNGIDVATVVYDEKPNERKVKVNFNKPGIV